jgi:aspartate/methionine/tyrosine aminotransferase
MSRAAGVSHRAAAVIAHDYDDFPVRPGDLDLRGDSSPALAITANELSRLSVDAEDMARYGNVAGEPELRQAIGGLFGVDAATVTVTAGASEALHLALTCLTDPGDQVMLPRPAFPGYDQLARLAGLRPVHYAVPGPVPSAARLPMLICTPHNPTGVTTSTRQASHRAGCTIWDVSHSSLSAQQARGVRAALAADGVVVFSLSKLLRLPGLRIGCLIAASPAVVTAATAAKTHLSMSADRLAQRLAWKILTHPGTLAAVAARSRDLAALRTTMLRAAEESAVLEAAAAQDGSFVFLRTRDGRDAAQFLRQAGITGLPGTVFNSTADTARLCIAQDPAVISLAAQRIAAL